MERQLRIQRADLLAVAERRDCYGTIYIAELCRFEQRKRRNALASGKLKSICNQSIVLVAANLDFVGIALAIVRELGFHAGFSDQSI